MPVPEKNPWPLRAKKFLIAVATAIVNIAAVWADAPQWFYPVASIAGAILVYTVGNAPKYQTPTQRT